MKRIDELFVVHRARSDLFEEYEQGACAYVSNTSDANGVMGFVKPRPTDIVFGFTGIVINSFSRTPRSCGARVQIPPFIACGRSGNGLLVLEPRKPMSNGRLAYIAAYINRVHGWRFTWYRQATLDRAINLTVPDNAPNVSFPVKKLLPSRGKPKLLRVSLVSKLIRLDRLFDLRPGNHHAESALDVGSTPLVSCGDENNGVVGFYDVPPKYANCLSIAFNGRPLTTKYHPYKFAAKDDVAVAIPRQPLELTTLLFVQMMLNRERWRYSYYRKCYAEKLNRVEIPLPHGKDGQLDEGGMKSTIETAPYWTWLCNKLRAFQSQRMLPEDVIQ